MVGEEDGVAGTNGSHGLHQPHLLDVAIDDTGRTRGKDGHDIDHRAGSCHHEERPRRSLTDPPRERREIGRVRREPPEAHQLLGVGEAREVLLIRNRYGTDTRLGEDRLDAAPEDR